MFMKKTKLMVHCNSLTLSLQLQQYRKSVKNLKFFQKLNNYIYFFLVCGKPNNFTFRIIGGKESTVHEYPWQVYVKVTERKDNFLYNSNCGGSIISDEFVVTAAHCFQRLFNLFFL